MINKKRLRKQFLQYTAQSILGMIGVSAFVLVDTFFISIAAGADGIAALNLALPMYSVLYAIGAMFALGGGIRFSIDKGRGEDTGTECFSRSIIWGFIFSIPFMILGLFYAEEVIRFFGGGDSLVAAGKGYMGTFLSFAPLFVEYKILNAFTRNDGAPEVEMRATVISNLSNIVLDYVFMFPLGMGMTGAALATSISPGISMVICSARIFKGESSFRLRFSKLSIAGLLDSMKLGLPAFSGEFASGVTMAVFNTLILRIAGNNGVAAFGIIANVSLVTVAIYEGISQGNQPILSRCYGEGNTKAQHYLYKCAVVMSLCVSAIILLVTNVFPEEIVHVFNSEGNHQMVEYAVIGMRIYFSGMIFTGINIVSCGYLGATEKSSDAFTISLLRGLVMISICAIVLSSLLQMTGIWLSLPAAEFLTMIVSLWLVRKASAKNGKELTV